MSTDSRDAIAKIRSLSWINLFANSADQIAIVALPVILVSQFGGDAGVTSLVTVAATLPMLLFSLPLGALADRIPLRRILFGGELVRFVSMIGLLLAVQDDAPAMWIVGFLALAGGTGTVAFQVAAPAMIARTTTGRDRQQLNSNVELARSIAITAGPPVAGILVSFAGGSLAFAFAAIFVATALFAITRLPIVNTSPTVPMPLSRQLGDGLRSTFSHPMLRPILWVSLAFNLGWYVLLGVIVAWAGNEINLSTFSIGVMFACYGIGMVVGAAFMRRFANMIPPGILIRIGPYCGFAFAGLVALTLVVPQPAILYLAFLAIGFGPTIWTVTTVGIRQAVTPFEFLGRVNATNMTISAGSRPIGAALGYALFTFSGYGEVFLLALVLFGVQAVLIGKTPLATDALHAKLAINVVQAPVPGND